MHATLTTDTPSLACGRRAPARSVRGSAVLVLFVLAGCGPSSREPVAPGHRDDLDVRVRQLLDKHLAAARTSPGDARAHATLGLVYEANGLWSEALRSFANAVALDRTEPLWRYHQAIAHRQLGEFGPALELLRGAARQRSDSAAIQQRLGSVLLETGAFDEALEHFRLATELAPQRATILRISPMT